MNSRFDHRTKDLFKRDIKFGTMLENYWWKLWLEQIDDRCDIYVGNPRDNGCGNDGEFIASGNTAGADFMCDISYQEEEEIMTIEDLPIEMKWVPTAGKFTLKENDLKAYIRERAAILFIYNVKQCSVNLRKPKDHDLDKHIAKIEAKLDVGEIQWGLMWPDKVEEFYNYAKDRRLIKPIYYMGNKPGVVMGQNEFDIWFKQELWNV